MSDRLNAVNYQSDLHLIAQSEEQKLLTDTLHSWAQSTILPQVQHWDEEQELPAKVLREAEELGLYSISIKESLGGSEMGYSASLTAVEV